MDLLESIAADGFQAVRPDQLPDVAAACWKITEETGDGRYSILAAMFGGLGDWWEADGGVPQILASEIERILREELVRVLEAATPAAGAERAANLSHAVASRQLPPQEWLRRGYVTTLQRP